MSYSCCIVSRVSYSVVQLHSVESVVSCRAVRLDTVLRGWFRYRVVLLVTQWVQIMYDGCIDKPFLFFTGDEGFYPLVLEEYICGYIDTADEGKLPPYPHP